MRRQSRRWPTWLTLVGFLIVLAVPVSAGTRGTGATARLAWTRFASTDALAPTDAALAADRNGNLYFGADVSETTSSGGQRVAPGTRAPGYDFWVLKMTPTGKVAWLVSLGGSGVDTLRDIEVLPDGRVVLAVSTNSPDFPGLGLTDRRPTGNNDAVITLLDPENGGVLWSRAFGGPDNDVVQELAAGPKGSIVAAGSTVPSKSKYVPDADDSISTAEGISPVVPFVAKLTGDGAMRWFTTVLPRRRTPIGQNYAIGRAVGVDRSGRVVISGFTSNPALPTTSGAVQRRLVPNNGDQGFVFAFTPKGKVAWGSYLGGHGPTVPESVRIADDGSIAIVGSTLAQDFPRSRPLQRTCAAGGSSDAFITWLRPNGRHLVRSTCWGGPDGDVAYDAASANDGTLLITGQTGSAFPVQGRCRGARVGGVGDAFVLAIGPDRAVRRAVPFGGSGSDQGYSVAAFPGGVAVGGWTDSTDFPGARRGDPDGPRALGPTGSAWSSMFLSRFTGL